VATKRDLRSLWQSLKGEFEKFIDFNAQPRVSSAGSHQRGA